MESGAPLDGKKPGSNFSVGVNVSPRQFFDTAFIELLRELIASRPDLAKNIELEITEEIMIGNFDEAISLMHGIRDMGFSLAIDDFGTGYSSISYLHKLPVDKIKIDKSFIDGAAQNSQSGAIVQSIIDLSHNLGMKVIAEGVETEEQVAFLEKNACDEYQGYYFSEPLPMAMFESRFVWPPKKPRRWRAA